MTVLKTFTIVGALFASLTSLAMAQNGLPTGNYPPVMGGAGGNPAVSAPGGYVQYTTPIENAARVHTSRHHKQLYMTTRQHKAY